MLGVTKHGNTTYTYQELDPANGYQIDVNVTGDTAFANYTATDFTGVPAVSVSMVDSTNGKTYTKTLGGYFLHTSNGKYASSKPMLFYVQKYTQSNAETEIYTTEKTFSGPLSAVVYVGSELSADSKEFYDYFLILGQSGDLYELCLTSYLDGGTLKLNARSNVTKVATLNVKSTSGATFTRVSANCAYLSVNGANTVELYSFNLATYELKDLGKIQGAMSLVGLHSDAELAGVFEEDRPDTPVQPEPGCQHTTTKVEGAKEATCTEPGYTGDTVCADCGETVAAGEVIPAPGHSFENGVCTKCGATDPNYKPPVTPDEPDEDAKTLIAYVTTADGNVWVAINPETLEITVLNDYSEMSYDGAGLGVDGNIYATVNGNYVMIDPDNGFAATVGGESKYSLPIFDGAPSAPAQTLQLKDIQTGNTYAATVGGYMFYTTDDWDWPNMIKLFDYSASTTKLHDVYDEYGVYGDAIAFLFAEQVDESYFHEYYLVLSHDGKLYKHTEKTRYYNDSLGYSRTVEQLDELDLDLSNGASMTMLNETTALISINKTTSVELYTYDVTTKTLTKLGALNGVTGLVGLSMIGGIETPEQPECNHSDLGEWEYDANGHWKSCECGEIVDQGAHEFENGVCFCGYADPTYEVPCEHTNVGKWKHDAAAHWQICSDCGETVNRGVHQFVNGYCTSCSRPCDHTDLGEWNYYEGHHWQYCVCGELVNYGPHEFHNGTCVCGTPCPHAVIGAWEYDENGHWKTCSCGDKVSEGAHSFNNGKCTCGYADPNYVPETPEEPSDDITWLHAYVKTGSGYAWVMIDPTTGAYEVIAEDTAEYTGGGYSDGKIYTTVNDDYGIPTLYIVDASDNYVTSTGFTDDITYVAMMDAASGPAKTVTINGTEVQVGRPVFVGYDPVYAVSEQYITVIIDPDDCYASAYVVEYCYDGTTMQGIAFLSGEMAADGNAYVETFAILCNDGKLYTCTITYTGNTYAGIDIVLGEYVQTGLINNGASMTLVGENELCIALTAASGVELYSYDLITGDATKLCTVANAQSLVALNLMSEVRPELVPAPEQPEQPEETAAAYHAYIKTGSGYAWVKIDPTTGAYEVIAEDTAEYTGGGYAEGMIYTTVNDDSGIPTLYIVDASGNYVASTGFTDDCFFVAAMDVSGGSAKTVIINGTEVQVGRPVYVGYDSYVAETQYVTVIMDPDDCYASAFVSADYYDGTIMQGIAFLSGEMAADGNAYVETFAILCNDGKLYTCTITYTGNTHTGINIVLGEYVQTGLINNGASMTLVGENELCIALTTASGVELYSYDLTTGDATKLCTVANAQSLVALNLMSDIAVQTTAAAKVPTGSLLSVSVASEATEPAQGENVVFADGNVTVNIADNATNGLLEVTFDPAVLTYQGIYSASAFYAVNDTQAAGGKLIIAYAAATKLSAEDVLAALNFSYTGNGVHTAISVTTLERGEEAELAEKMEIVVSNCAHEQTEIVGTVEATCTEPGYTGDVCCALCGALITAGEQIPAAHRYVGALIEAPTAVATGRLSVFCAGCEDSFQLEIPALNAIDYSYRVVQLPTATSDGIGRYTWKMTDYGSFSFDVIIRHEVAQTDAQIIIESKLAAAGKTVRLEVVLQNNPGIQGLIAQLRYDESVMTLVSVENGVVLGDLDQGRNLLWAADSDVMADGVLCVLEFQIAENAPMGYYPVSLVLEEAANENDEPVALHMVYANVQILDVLYGDVNGDGQISLTDVLRLRRYLANRDENGNCDVVVDKGADVNGDGDIDLIDVLRLRKYMADRDPVTGESSVVLGPQQ